MSAAMSKMVAKSHLFKSVDDAGRDRIVASGSICKFKKGATLVTQDEPGNLMYLLLSGTVQVQAATPGGVVHLAQLGEGACVGEVSVIKGGGRTATVTALTKVQCIVFEKEKIEAIVAEYPKVRAILEKMIEGRARDTIAKIVGS